MDLIGDKWTMLIIRDLYLGKRLFREFRQSPEGIATNILTNRLNRLTEEGLVKRVPSPHKAGTDAYELSERGMTLLPVLEAIAEWGEKHLEGTYFGMGRKPA